MDLEPWHVIHQIYGTSKAEKKILDPGKFLIRNCRNIFSVHSDLAGETGKAVQTSQQLRGRHGRSTLPNIF